MVGMQVGRRGGEGGKGKVDACSVNVGNGERLLSKRPPTVS